MLMNINQYLIILCALFVGHWASAQLPTPKPNFIFYLSDDHDMLDYGSYGNSKVYTPAVDRLASEGLRFTKSYTAQAICAPSRSQLYTGTYPFKNGCIANHLPSKPTINSVTDYLKELGYEVILAGKSHVGPDDVYHWTHYWPSGKKRELPFDAIEAYLENAQGPFCMFIASEYPHAPYPEKTKYSADRIQQHAYESDIPLFKGGYYENIETDNEQLQRVLALVDQYGLRDSTVFIYASDHSISGKFSVKEKGLRVPLIIRWPGKIKPGQTNANYVGMVDVVPTFIEIAGGTAPDYLDGKSFLNLIEGEKLENHQYIYGIATHQNIRNSNVFPSRMIISARENFKLIKNFNSLEVYRQNLGDDPAVNAFIKRGAEAFPEVPYEELYDLNNDPFEQRNLAKVKRYQKLKRKLSDQLQQWMEEQGDFLAVPGAMPLIKPTAHSLDQNSQWQHIPAELVGALKEDVYIELHY